MAAPQIVVQQAAEAAAADAKDTAVPRPGLDRQSSRYEHEHEHRSVQFGKNFWAKMNNR